jgi:hypothetical protein
MKRFILLALLSFIGITMKAQYNNYNPYHYAAASAEVNETYKLNNIRFNESALIKNPTAWRAYNNYLYRNTEYAKKYRTYSAIGWSGAGVACLSLIPLLIESGYDYDDPRSDTMFAIGIGGASVGLITACVGYLGMAFQMDKIKTNKKEFIYYLKTTHNGIGIVSIF